MQNDVACSAFNEDDSVHSKSRSYFLPKSVDFNSVIYRQKPSQLPLNSYMESRYVMQHQDLINRNALCLTRLREAAREVESLRLENATLRSINSDLNNNLNYLIQNQFLPSREFNTTPFDMFNNEFYNFCNLNGVNDDEEEDDDVAEEEEKESPTSVMEMKNVETAPSSERVTLPKSISVRSSGYLKSTQPSGSKTRSDKTRPKPLSQLASAQKVYVKGGKKEEDPVELEVYNQGMFKTELCNKWQETGACPYSENCQFAHGIEELRPVIRHPRYKTEVCRMVLAGDVCPYGHRCHFRHVLTEEEKQMGVQFKNRSIKLRR